MTSAHQQLLLQALAHKSSSTVNTDTQEGIQSPCGMARAYAGHASHPLLWPFTSNAQGITQRVYTHLTREGCHLQIRHYATEDRKGLSDIASEGWPAAFAEVCEISS